MEARNLDGERGNIRRAHHRGEAGVIKCMAITALLDDNRFDAKMLESIRGVPWRPSTKHAGSRLRTHIKEDDYDDD